MEHSRIPLNWEDRLDRAVLSLLCCTEPLALLVFKDNNIKGIKTPLNNPVKLVQYADDITITTQDEGDIEKVMTHLQTYGEACAVWGLL